MTDWHRSDKVTEAYLNINREARVANMPGHIIVDKASDPYITEDKETHNIRVCIVVEDDKGGKHLIDFPMRIAEWLFKGTQAT
jgi:hypothetical protein